MAEDMKTEDSSSRPWEVDEKNESIYNDSDEKGLWQPKADVILSMFKKLSEGGAGLPLTWTCPGRRAPQSEVKEEEREDEAMDVDDEEEKEEATSVPEPSAFDFDEIQSDGNSKLVPKRTPGGNVRTPRTEKRVARMDNIMNSLKREQLQRSAEREARIKAKGSPSAGRARLLNFGSPSGPRPPQSPGVRVQTGSRPPATAAPRVAIGNPSPAPTSAAAAASTPSSAAKAGTPGFGVEKSTTNIKVPPPSITSLEPTATSAPAGTTTSSETPAAGGAATGEGATATGSTTVAADVGDSNEPSVEKDISAGVAPTNANVKLPGDPVKVSSIGEMTNITVTNSLSTNEPSSSVATSVGSLTISPHISAAGIQGDSLLKCPTSSSLSKPTDATSLSSGDDRLPLDKSGPVTNSSVKKAEEDTCNTVGLPSTVASTVESSTVENTTAMDTSVQPEDKNTGVSEKPPELMTLDKETAAEPNKPNKPPAPITAVNQTSSQPTVEVPSTKDTLTTETAKQTDLAVSVASELTPATSIALPTSIAPTTCVSSTNPVLASATSASTASLISKSNNPPDIKKPSTPPTSKVEDTEKSAPTSETVAVTEPSANDSSSAGSQAAPPKVMSKDESEPS